MSNLPVASEQPIDSRTGHFSLPWRRWLEAVNRALNQAGTDTTALSTEVAALAAEVAAIPTTTTVIRGRDGITVEGTLAHGPITIGYQGASINYAAVMARISLRC